MQSLVGLRISAGTAQGAPQDVIIEEARGWQADCVVLGSQLGAQTESLFDSGIYAAVIAETECSLEVVR